MLGPGLVPDCHRANRSCECCPGPIPGWQRAARSWEQHPGLSVFCEQHSSVLCHPASVSWGRGWGGRGGMSNILGRSQVHRELGVVVALGRVLDPWTFPDL